MKIFSKNKPRNLWQESPAWGTTRLATVLLTALSVQLSTAASSEKVVPLESNTTAKKGFEATTFSLFQKKVTGKVLDADGNPIPGANIIAKGSNASAQTDFNGNFTIEVPDNVTKLIISFIGMEQQEVTIGKSPITVILKETGQSLDEVVITGYGKQNRATLTTSISKLDTRILETSSRSNVATALQGTIAGLRVTNNTGQPGSTPSIVLRGGTNFNGSGSPLILVDGIPSDFYALNPDDVASIEVLKDAASTAIYGARSANGVILVTTKTGKAGRSSINYKYKFSVNKERNDQQFLSAADFIKYNRQSVAYQRQAANKPNDFANFLDGATAFGTGGNTTNSPYTVQFLTPTNEYLLSQPGWKTITDPLNASKQILFLDNDVSDLIYQNSVTKDHYLSFDGGNDKGTYYLGLGVLDNDGLVLGSGFKRYSGKFSGSYKITDKVKVNSNILYSHSNLSLSPLGPDSDVFQRFAGQAPTSRTYDNNPDGTLSSVLSPGTNFSFGNPLYYQDKFIRKNLEQRLSASAGLDWDIIDDLTLSLKASHFTINNHKENFNKAYIEGASSNAPITTRFASVSLDRTLRNQLTGTLNYTKKFGSHNFNALLGAEYFKDNVFFSGAGTKNSPTDLIETLNAGAEVDGKPFSFESEQVIVSTFGRLIYDYDNKYLLSATFRRDGASRLGNQKFDVFPGVSVGWNAHNEKFLEGVSKYVSKLKPRLSYGVNGDVSSITSPGQRDYTGNYTVFGSYGSQGVYNGQTGYANTGLPTLDLEWERSTTLNAGLDVSFFNNRLNFITDLYSRDVKGKISPLTLPFWTGFSSIRTNNGVIRNKGFELELNADIIRNDNVTWNVGATYTANKNYVISLPKSNRAFNGQDGTEVYDPATGLTKWVGGLEEGKRVGLDEIVVYVQDYIYADQAAVDAHATRQDVLLPNHFKRYPGDVAWKDLNGDNIINSLDRKVIGRSTPKLVGGFTSNVSYKNLSLFVKTDFATGHLVYNHIRGKGYAQTQGNLNQPIEILDSWTPQNTNTDWPRMVFVDAQRNVLRGDGTVSRNSQFWEKGDYLALREVTLNYNLPVKKYFKGVIQNFNLYATGSNLHYFKSYSGDTPEVGGAQEGAFPMPRTITIGLNVTF
ncbi:SusC/RagA family TonB-linked outer membrane protein [Flavobacterium acetivorans]|uniref:SusC/RagA family TonB-linked outer membrane protein n=1 Tax=Flavobacterium acetivorans TaxID=2893883 RepID=UPI001E30110E|nr:TonB-dependent receptor [Flavobacterium sp. F-29]UFH34344.1 TonB-dependent receptor [Flavobacterium sp. F-29]